MKLFDSLGEFESVPLGTPKVLGSGNPHMTLTAPLPSGLHVWQTGKGHQPAPIP